MSIDWFPLWLSLRVAGFATVISLGISLPLAFLLATRGWRGRDLLDAVTTLPLVLPPTVLGYYLLVVIGRQSLLGRLYEWIFGTPLVFTWQAATLAALFHSTPLLIKFARAAFESIDPSFERAARNLGASEWKVFWLVTVPLARRSIFAAAALAFARSLGGRDRDPLPHQPPGTETDRPMIQARIAKRFAPGPESAGFSLSVELQAAAGVTVLFG